MRFNSQLTRLGTASRYICSKLGLRKAFFFNTTHEVPSVVFFMLYLIFIGLQE